MTRLLPQPVLTRVVNCWTLNNDQQSTNNEQRSTEQMITNYNEFWDFYVQEHSRPMTRVLHFAGTSLGLLLLVFFIWRGTWYYFPISLIIGYAFAWFAHFVVEKNKPATFQYPLWSFISDYKMMWYMLTGRMGAEVQRVTRKS